MIKIGVIGLGDIAQKAYLPVLAKKKIEVHLHTRNESKLRQVGQTYRFANLHPNIGSLVSSGIKAAFVHTATDSHYPVIEQLLKSNIHVYVDKPLTYEFATAKKLATLANEKKLMLKVGFNRRYAPAYKKLKELTDINMIIMQKNRKSLPGDVRTFIFDDFIHVVDTLLFLFPHAVEKLVVSGRKHNNLLYHVVIQFHSSDGRIAIGVMNRDSGTVMEKLEVFTGDQTTVVTNLTESISYQDKNETKINIDDWASTLHRRGFEQIVEEFLQAVESDNFQQYENDNDLSTHQICEEIVNRLEQMK